MSIGIPQKRRKVSAQIPTIGFSDEDLTNVLYPHSDPLFMTMKISGTDVWRILVDDGSSVDILYYHAFKKIGFADRHLAPSPGPIYVVNYIEVPVVGTIKLPIVLGSGDRNVTQFINWLVIKGPTHYNGIFGREGIATFRGVASFMYQAFKFPTPNIIGVVEGKQKATRECHLATFKSDEHREHHELVMSGSLIKLADSTPSGSQGKRVKAKTDPSDKGKKKWMAQH
ncbi:uncharacterized protein [Rutidosis leptorrhynchoides]|uniref:uncharacterized protein n=1 Tax=Rutidosis leptorrhynchoides TaxID=125765 RepID=UPI003A9961F6